MIFEPVDSEKYYSKWQIIHQKQELKEENMKKIIGVILTVTLLVAFIGCSGTQTEKAKADAGDNNTIGTIQLTELTDLNKVVQNPVEFVGKPILVEGTATGICKGTGCWVSLDTGDPEKAFLAKSWDHSFVFPKDCVGKKIQIEGVFSIHQPEEEVAEEKEHGEGHGEEHGEEGHECPSPTYYLNPTGAKIVS